MNVKFELNGKQQSVDTDPDKPLLWVLRDELGLTGTKFGCGRGLCGACTIHVEGRATRSCAFPIKFAAGKSVETIENLETTTIGEAVVQAWIEHDVVQCGWCQPGQCMSAAALLNEVPNPNDDAIDAAMSGNICRCGAYPRIRKAIKTAAQTVTQEEQQ